MKFILCKKRMQFYETEIEGNKMHALVTLGSHAPLWTTWLTEPCLWVTSLTLTVTLVLTIGAISSKGAGCKKKKIVNLCTVLRTITLNHRRFFLFFFLFVFRCNAHRWLQPHRFLGSPSTSSPFRDRRLGWPSDAGCRSWRNGLCEYSYSVSGCRVV